VVSHIKYSDGTDRQTDRQTEAQSEDVSTLSSSNLAELHHLVSLGLLPTLIQSLSQLLFGCNLDVQRSLLSLRDVRHSSLVQLRYLSVSATQPNQHSYSTQLLLLLLSTMHRFFLKK